MNTPFFLIFLNLILIIPVASASTSTDDDSKFLDTIQNQKFVATVDQLPYTTVSPEINWQTNGNIKGWVDIVGWKNLTRVGDTFYTYGTLADTIIVDGGSIGLQSGIKDSITNTYSFSQSGVKLTVSMTVILQWHIVTCDKKGCYVSGRFTDTATYQDTDTIPQLFVMPGNQSVLLKHYTGKPYHPNILVFDGISPVITDIRATTNNGSMIHHTKIGILNYTEKNVPYIEIFGFNSWEYTGANHTISSFINEMVSDENFTSVSFLTPYGWVGANITEQTMEASHIHWEVFGIIFAVGIFLYGIYRMWVKAIAS
jgi:hypothetical protein